LSIGDKTPGMQSQGWLTPAKIGDGLDIASLEGVDRAAMAQHYARDRGFRIIPISPNSKTPYTAIIGASWTDFVRNAIDEAQVSKWFELEPSLNVAIVAGPESGGFVALDIDYGPTKKRSNGDEMPEWLLSFLERAGTPVVLTPSGGCHVWCYVRPEDHQTNTDIVIGGVSVNIRADRQYVVAPLSTIGEGEYRFVGTPPKKLRWLHSVLDELRSLAPAQTDKEPRIKRRTPYYTSLDTQWSGEVTAEGLEALYAENEVVRKLCPFLKIPVAAVDWKTGRSRTFTCPLHPDQTPSATLTRSPSGAWTLKCGHVHRGSVVWQLPQVYAGLRGVKRQHVKGGQMAMWSLRLLAHGGVLMPAEVDVQIPDDLSQDGLKVLAVVREVVGLRLAWTGELDFPLSQGFVARWSDLNVRRFRVGMAELLDRKVVYKVGEYDSGKRPGFIYSLSRRRPS